MPIKYLQSKTHAVWYLGVSDDADSESDVLSRFREHILPLFRFYRHILPLFFCVIPVLNQENGHILISYYVLDYYYSELI